LGIPSTFPFVFINCTCIIQEQETPAQVICRVPNIALAIQTNAFITPCKDLARHTSFAMKRVAELTHHASYQYNINRTMRYEFEFFCDKLKPDSGIEWEMPIAH
jgi:hypothetical protein